MVDGAMTRDELQRLIDTIVSELMPTLARQPQGRCACHSVLDDCCPDRLRGVLDAGASRVGMYAGGGAPVGVASMIDHTLLKPDATRGEIEALCREAAQFKFATVCVKPDVGRRCREAPRRERRRCLLGGRLPAGRDHAGRERLRDPPGDLRRRARDRHGDQCRRPQSRATCASSSATSKRVTTPCREAGVLSKVIIEAALLTDDEKSQRARWRRRRAPTM